MSSFSTARALPIRRRVARLLVLVIWAQTVAPPAASSPPMMPLAKTSRQIPTEIPGWRERPIANSEAGSKTAVRAISVSQSATGSGIHLTALATAFNDHLGIDHHQLTGTIVLSANQPSGLPHTFESLDADGTHRPFSNVAALGGELKIATARDDGQGKSRGGFTPGDLFTGTGVPGVIARLDAGGQTMRNPWVALPGEAGLLAGGLFVDRTGVFGGDLIAVTTRGGVWRIASTGVATRLADLGTHLEGVTTIPDNAATYGPWAGKILVGAKDQKAIYAIDVLGRATSYQVNINLQDIRVIPARENFYGIDPVARKILGAPDDAFTGMIGDILLAQKSPGALFRLHWNGSSFEVSQIAQTTAWEQITFSPAGIEGIPAVKQVYDRIAVVRHAPIVNSGRVEGALWQLLGENVTLDGNDVITSDLLVPGMPTVTVGGGHPTFSGVIEGDESPLPADYAVTITGNASLRHLVTRTDPIELEDVAPPPGPTGTRDVSLSKANESAGDFSTLRHLSLSGKAGAVPVPPGTYGRFKASGQTALILGVEGSTEPAVYNLEELALTGGSELRLVGPVVITVARRVVVSGGAAGFPAEPRRLLLRVANADDDLSLSTDDGGAGCGSDDSDGGAGGVSVCGNGVLYGIVRAPQGSVAIAGNGRLRGTVMSDRLTVSGNGVLQITENDVPAPAVNRPPTVDAGADQTITLPVDTASVNATVSDDGLPHGSTISVTWTDVSGPAAVSFADPDSAATTATFTQPGLYVLRATASDSLLTGSDELTVEVMPANQPPTVDAGADQTIALADTATLSGIVNDDGLPQGSSVITTWSQESGPGVATFANASAVSTTASFSEPGIYVLRLSADDSELTGSDDVMITVHAINRAPTVSAGADQTITLPGPVSLNGSVNDDGLPPGSTLAISWSVESGPGMVTFGNPAAPVTTAVFITPGFYVLRLSASDSEFTSKDEVTIEVDDGNLGPMVSAGSDQVVRLPDTATLQGSANDDGLPAGGTLTTSWSRVGGPGTVTFSNATSATTTASFSAEGNYVLRLTANDSRVTSSDDVLITVGAANQPPAVDAGSNQSITLPNTANLSGTVSDDGLPASSVVAASWSVVSGPGSVTFDNPQAPATVATFSAPGTYVLRLTASDSQLTALDEVTVTVDVFLFNQAPAVGAGPDQTVTLPVSASLTGTVSDDGLPTGSMPIAGWSQVSGPGTVSFDNANALVTTASFSAAGTYVLRLSATDSELVGSDDVTVQVRTPVLDLAVGGVDTSAVATDPQTLVISGAVQMSIQNNGTDSATGSFEVVVFEDANGNGTYQAAVDKLLGVEVFAGSIAGNGVVPFAVPVSGVVSFGGNSVYVFVDSAHQVTETDETNNVKSSGLGSTYQPSPGDFAWKVKWQFNSTLTTNTGVSVAPVVAPLIDTNIDGVINNRDVPAVMFMLGGNAQGYEPRLMAIRGDTAAPILEIPSAYNVFGSDTNLAVGDLDGTGGRQIVVAEHGRGIIRVYNSNGTLQWTSQAVPYRSSPTLADLDADGHVEILYGCTVFNFDGTIRRLDCPPGIPSYVGGNSQTAAAPQAADLDLDGKLEIISGPAAIDRNGQAIWYWGTSTRDGLRGFLDYGKTIVTPPSAVNFVLSDGFTAVANFDSDPNPEILVVATRSYGSNTICADSLWIFEHDGRLKSGFPQCVHQDIVNGTRVTLGPPTVANIDADPLPEIVFPMAWDVTGLVNGTEVSRYTLAAFEDDGQPKWQIDLLAGQSSPSPPPATAFDVDGDGKAEIIYLDQQILYTINGSDGTILHRFGIGGDALGTRYAVVADGDNDGKADLIVPAATPGDGSAPRRGVLMMSDITGNVRNARRVWNQWLNHVTNVNEDGSIPATPKNNWQFLNTSRTQASIDGADPLAAPDLAVSRFTIGSQSCPAAVGLTVRVGNAGTLQAGAGQRVSFYSGDPTAGGQLLGDTHTTRHLWPGEYEDVTLTTAAPFPSQVFAVVGTSPTPTVVQSTNLAQLPHTWAQASGYCKGCEVVANIFAYRGIDGSNSSIWLENPYRPGDVVTIGDHFFEVHFPFEVNATSFTLHNNTSSVLRQSRILTGVLTGSNGFSMPVTFDANGEGTFTFAEQHVRWMRLTATTFGPDGPSLSEFVVGGSYTEPQFSTKEGANGAANNTTFSPPGLALCDPSVEQPPFITSAPPINGTVETQYSYQLQTGDINNDPLSFSLPVAPAGMTISATGLIAWTPSNAQQGNHPVTVEVSDGRGGTAEQSFVLRVRPPNHPPAITAGADQSITLNTPAILNATADDDGLPAGSVLTAAWSVVSGPGSVSFVSAKAVATAATFSAVGTYVLRLTVSDSQFTVADDVTIVVDPIPANRAPVVDAGPDQAVTLPHQLALFTNVTDDALPVGSVITSSWSQVSGPGTVTFTPGLANVVTATFSEPGLYVLRLTAADGDLTGSDDIATNVIGAPVNHAPAVNAGADHTINLPDAASLAGVIADDGLPTSGTLTALWSQVSGPATVTFADPSQAATAATFSTAGTYVLRLSAGDSELSASDDVSIEVFDPITGPAPTVSIQSPADGSDITTKVDIVGTISGGNWRLEYSLNSDDGSNSQPWTTIASGNSPVTNGVLGSFDPTLLLNGVYDVRLVSRDSAGQTSLVELSAIVTGDQKVGNFSLAFVDLDVPVAGLPIQVVRSYDSRDKRKGDFGVGWTLGIKNVMVGGKLGKQWVQTKSAGFAPRYCLQPSRPQTVTVTFGDGRVYAFEPVTMPQCQTLFAIQLAAIGFRQLPGSRGTPGATLESLSGVDVIVSGSAPGPAELLDLSTLLPFNPTLFRLTTAEGDVYVIDQRGGVRSMTDPNGNTLTINSNGIVHSSGKSVTFARDAQNRVTGITDPAGRAMTYAYDNNGDLVSFTDREDNVTAFTYNSSHGLLRITDPRGVEPVRNEYDANGRLVRHIDAFGKEINYTHDLDSRQEIVTDRLGNVTIHEYDASGNILRTTDAEGGVTTFTYDARGNTLSVTNAVGKTTAYTYDALDNKTSETDPLGNTRTYTYNNRRQVLTSTDARGGVTTNTYDSKGNLSSTKDAAGNVTSYTYIGNGLRASQTGALGSVTRYEYDAAGNRTKETGPLGDVVSYTYDHNGNQLSLTASRSTDSGDVETLITTFEYDELDRLVKIMLPDGSSREVAYDAIGKESAVKDPLGNQTAYEYDGMGRLVRTTHADGTHEESTYDAEGRRLTATDRAGRLTTYRHDKLGRLLEAVFPDNTRTTRAYDAIGREIAVTDERGSTTTYEHDPACGCNDRPRRIIDAIGNVTTFTYDANGNRLTITDPAGTTTRNVYDANNRRTRVEFADGTASDVTYDALGRTTATTDQAGHTTRFEYDPLDLLVRVTDALGQLTTYTYDEMGNRLSQTDANNHTTTFEYDNLGRQVKRQLPLGMAETFVYDAAGNVASRTDFRARTTTYAYGVMNRLLSKTPDPTLNQAAVIFSYTATGQRASMTDASGTTTYAYDARDRLTSKATPQGTLTYSYDAAGNLLGIDSSNANGASVQYEYDMLNRLSSAKDSRLPAGANTTTYTYDRNSNLDSYTYPNGVRSGYTYNSLNRLTDLTIAKTNTLASYAYTLGAVGNRLSVSELAGRTVDYAFDALYRLTNETINGGSANGAVSYTYDAVGNRVSRTSTLSGIASANHAYDANDRLTTDTYDQNGNTIGSDGKTYSYNFEDRLTEVDGGMVRLIYDGDGNRVAKTVSGITTRYLVDSNNLSGHAQVLEEIVDGSVQRVYTYGLDLISQHQVLGGAWTARFYGYDGQGSVRLLTDSTGAITDTYTYDAFGNLIARTGTTPNDYLYRGEQLDANIGFYYLRARYYNHGMGRFMTTDPFEGHVFDPMSLHRYTYAHNDPIDNSDPSGAFTLMQISVALSIVSILYNLALPHFCPDDTTPGSTKRSICFFAKAIGYVLQVASLLTGVGAIGQQVMGRVAQAAIGASRLTTSAATIGAGFGATSRFGAGAAGSFLGAGGGEFFSFAALRVFNKLFLALIPTFAARQIIRETVEQAGGKLLLRGVLELAKYFRNNPQALPGMLRDPRFQKIAFDALDDMIQLLERAVL